MRFGWENLKTGKFLQIFCLCSFLFCNTALAGPEKGEEEIYTVSESEPHSFLSYIGLGSEGIKEEVSHLKKAEEGAGLLDENGADLSEKEREQVINERILPHLRKMTSAAALFLFYTPPPTFSKKEREQIISQLSDLVDSLMFLRQYPLIFSETERKQIINKTSPDFAEADQAARFLVGGDSTLPEGKRKEIMDEKILPYITSFENGQLLLYMHSSVFSKEEKKQVVRKTLSFFKTDERRGVVGIASNFLSRYGWIEEDGQRTRIFSEEEGKQIINEYFLPLLDSAEKGWRLSRSGYWFSEERALILNKAVLARFDSAEEASKFFEEWNIGSPPKEDIREVVNWMIFRFRTAKEGIKIWKRWDTVDTMFDPEWQFIRDKILSLIETSEQGVEVLYELAVDNRNRLYGEKNRERIINKTASLMQTAPGTEFSDETRYEMVRQIVKNQRELRLFRHFLSDGSYRSIKTAMRQERFNCRIQWIKQRLPFVSEN